MTGLVRKATFFAVCGLLAANAAMASTPSAANSSTPTHINMVGYSANLNGAILPGTDAGPFPDRIDAPFTITVRDLNNLPVNNSFVVIDLSACHAMQICSDQGQAGITAVCNGQIRGFTGPDGKLAVSIGGHANNSGAAPLAGDTDPNDGLAGAGCASIEADGTPLRSNIILAAFDQDGNGVSTADDACQLGDFFGIRNSFPISNPRNPDRCNFDGVGGLTTNDRSQYLAVFFGVNVTGLTLSNQNCGTLNLVPQCAIIP